MRGEDKPTLYCGFCAKSEHDVRLLIGGNGSYICDECVDECVRICAEARIKAREAKHLTDVIRNGT